MITHIKPFIGGQMLQGSRQMNQSVKKAHLLAMARSWISLADHAERNSRIGSVYFDIGAMHN